MLISLINLRFSFAINQKTISSFADKTIVIMWLILRLKCLVLIFRVFWVVVVGGHGILPTVVGYAMSGARETKHTK